MLDLDWPVAVGELAAGGEYVRYAEVYDLLFADLHDDLEFYGRVAASFAPHGQRLLEVGCGTGRLTERLLANGHAVTGVDVSAPMIERGAAKLARFGDAWCGVLADVREMRLGASFPLAVMPYGTVAHLLSDDDRLRAFKALFEHLVPGGVLVFDDMPAWMVGGSDGSRLELRREGFDPVANMRVRLLSNAIDAADQPFTIRYDFIDWLSDDKVAKRAVIRIVFRNIGLDEELALLRTAGFHDIDVLGGFDGRPFDHDRPTANERLIVRCRRPI